jgi:hypothetical protein
MQHLINWIDSDCTPMDCVIKAKELLQMEKEQIINARINGDENHSFNSMVREEYANDYYNETYKQQDNDN